MKWLRQALRALFAPIEMALDRVVGPAWNPLGNLGALGFFFYWIVAVSGIYVYIFFDTGTTAAFRSVEAMTNEQWYAAGIMRSFHRYASDALVLVMAIHILREFSLDHYRGARWFTWVTGVPIFWLVFAAGVTGYWMVWDKLGHYVALVTSEWLDWLPIFGERIARNFINPHFLDDRFFTLLVFMHIILPLVLLAVLWIHLQRVSRPKINPPRGLAIAFFGMFVALALIQPVHSQGPADLTAVPATLELDWFYLAFYPLFDVLSSGAVWGIAGALTLMLAILPVMPPMRRPAVAQVDLPNCNGCTRCAEDCPFNAISMLPRSDGRPYEREAVVNASLCVSCGICAGACPTATPFGRTTDLVPGIELPGFPIAALRERMVSACAKLEGERRILVFGCDHGASVAGLAGRDTAAISLPCIAMLPPTFVDFALSNGLAEGVVLAGCRENGCYFRFGIDWTRDRIAATRDPKLRQRVPRERIGMVWAGRGHQRALARKIAAFRERLQPAPPAAAPSGPPAPPRRYEPVGDDA
jgi:quinol-cytochrome oxidoreductase complex cytochrome b subunit/coenzyme F420-reducing hydrogenase delta subunit